EGAGGGRGGTAHRAGRRAPSAVVLHALRPPLSAGRPRKTAAQTRRSEQAGVGTRSHPHPVGVARRPTDAVAVAPHRPAMAHFLSGDVHAFAGTPTRLVGLETPFGRYVC